MVHPWVGWVRVVNPVPNVLRGLLLGLVVTSALTSADVSLTSGSRSPDETDGDAGSGTHCIFVRFWREGKCHVKRGQKKQRYRSCTPLHLSTWQMTNSSSVRFVQKTLTGNAPVVVTMIIPFVASVAKDTGSGLLPPSVTWRLRSKASVSKVV